ncbi:NAD(P)-dependent oxidoreductase [Anaeroarcus burkinensis]|uniref:NAD(P)-dependent oxidoreductase n=1 Tax=Anaeroarcus burkinensis TaxID=82376 RepID=UPI000427B6E9|nr:NAD(P)-binding domain-containing protein [Anaeroarcus burkinensis]
MKTIGFVGMGIMGLPMAVNLVKKSGQEILGFDIFQEKRKQFAAQGGNAVDSAEVIFTQCDLIFLCLPTNDLVNQTIQKILAAAKPGAIIVDFSSTSPDVIRELYPQAQAKGVRLLDSPVSGGESGAIAGTLVLMCGGEQTVFDEVKPLLLHVGTSATYMGDTGCGCVAKLANNMIVGCNIAALAEGFAFAVKAGLNPTVLYEAIKDGFAGSPVMNVKAPKIISRDFSASARIAVHQKDLKNAVRLAEQLGVEIPLSAKVLDYMNQMEVAGKVDEDHCAIARIYERDMGVEIGEK